MGRASKIVLIKLNINCVSKKVYYFVLNGKLLDMYFKNIKI